MSANREEILQSALELPEADRLQIATELIDSVAGDWPGWNSDDPEFAAELERRAEDGSEAIPWDLVRTQLRADLKS